MLNINKNKFTDYDREKLTLVKVIYFFRVLFSKKAINILDSVEIFWNINFELLKLKWKKWIILDVDDCIAPHHWKILQENYKIIASLLKKWWEIVIFSNMKKTSRYVEIEKLWIKVITSKYAKPDKRWFEECLKVMRLKPKEVVMIWDNILTDWWATQLWIDFIKIKPISSFINENNINISRKIHIFIRKIIDKKIYK